MKKKRAVCVYLSRVQCMKQRCTWVASQEGAPRETLIALHHVKKGSNLREKGCFDTLTPTAGAAKIRSSKTFLSQLRQEF
jgi:hypothetical protein